MAEGTNINLPYAYHGFQSLQGVLQQKNQALEFYRFRGLNQAKKLLGKAAALSEQKRLLMAIASGEVQRIDCVISIGLLQKKGTKKTSWNRGWHLAEQDCEFLGSILSELDKDIDITILAPSGTILFNVPLVDDDIDESLKFPSPPPGISVSNHCAKSAETCVEVEDTLGELCLADAATISSQNRIIGSGVLINGKMKSKARALADYGKYGKCASSTDRLRCVQDIERHVQNKVISSSSTVMSFPLPEEDSQVLLL
jgi:hypothetical protein